MITSDVSLFGTQWTDDGRDMVLDLELPNSGRYFLTCTWAASISIDLTSKASEGGPPMTVETSFRHLDSGRTRITLDFLDRGSITLDCNEVMLSKVPSSEQAEDPKPDHASS